MSYWNPERKEIPLLVGSDEVTFVVDRYDDSMEIVDAYTTEVIVVDGKKGMRIRGWDKDIPSWTYDYLEEKWYA